MKKLVSLVLATMILCVGMRVSLEAATAGATHFEDRQQISQRLYEVSEVEDRQQISQWNDASDVIEKMERRGLDVSLSTKSWINNWSGSIADREEFEELCEEEQGAVWVNKNIEYRVVCELE
ncbi:MAG: hypothetical protein F6J93_36510 [Oscillatoria sp. SIO1A7]|nr:hypothetical protein [Oscillatoria sp. SIO1A7]